LREAKYDCGGFNAWPKMKNMREWFEMVEE
jgi:hypothetical protein